MIKLKSKKEGVLETPDGVFEVRVGVPPLEGQANKRTIELLAKHFKVSKSKIELVSGHKSKFKVFSVLI